MPRLLPIGRPRLLAALAVVVPLGMLSRLYPLGWHVFDKSLGDALYAVAVYLVLALFGLRPLPAALLALGMCTAIELFQLTGVGARYDHFLPVRWVLGTTFAWHDLACYVVGIVLVCVLDTLVLRCRCGRIVGRRFFPERTSDI